MGDGKSSKTRTRQANKQGRKDSGQMNKTGRRKKEAVKKRARKVQTPRKSQRDMMIGTAVGMKMNECATQKENEAFDSTSWM